MTTSYQRLYDSIMGATLMESTYNDGTERAFSVLHAAYPNANMQSVNHAVSYDWCDLLTDEQNINNCKYLEEDDLWID